MENYFHQTIEFDLAQITLLPVEHQSTILKIWQDEQHFRQKQIEENNKFLREEIRKKHKENIMGLIASSIFITFTLILASILFYLNMEIKACLILLGILRSGNILDYLRNQIPIKAFVPTK